MAKSTMISGLATHSSQLLVVAQRCLPLWFYLTLPTVLLYIILVYNLRHRRAKYLPMKFNLLSRESYRRMTTDEAQSILKDLTELEFPKIFGFSVIFALFKARSTFLLLISYAPVLKIPFNIAHHRPTVSRASQLSSPPQANSQALRLHLSELLTRVSCCLNLPSTNRRHRGQSNQ